jgi:sugar phosphate isomerase/epimerase
MNRLGIENISVFGLPPVEYVNLAADLGCANISLGLTPVHINPHAYAPFNLKDDAPLRREVRAALRDRGVTVSLAEGLTIRPGVDARDRSAEFDAFADLGAERVNVVSMDPDMEQTLDQMLVTARMAAERGMTCTLEFAPGLTVADLATAAATVRRIGRPDFRLLIDAMHLIRSGSTPGDLAALDPGLIDYLQFCDVPLESPHPSYMLEAMTERKVPGQGELPLLDILRAIPARCVVSLEVPLLGEARRGTGPRERLAPAVAATRTLLAQLERRP